MDRLAPYMNMIVTTLVVLGLVIAALLLFRALNSRVRGRKGARLGISEYHEIDKTRRLVLVRRDDTEHLILVGGPQDVVIESGIDSPLMVAQQQTGGIPPYPGFQNSPPQSGNIQPLPMRPAPRPAIFGERRSPLRSVEPNMGMTRNEPEER